MVLSRGRSACVQITTQCIDIDCIYVSFGIVVHAYHEIKNSAPCLFEVVNLRMVMFSFTAQLCLNVGDPIPVFQEKIYMVQNATSHFGPACGLRAWKIHRKKCCSEILLNAWGVVVDND